MMKASTVILFTFALTAAVCSGKEHAKSADKKTDKRGLDDATSTTGAVSYSHLVQNHRHVEHPQPSEVHQRPHFRTVQDHQLKPSAEYYAPVPLYVERPLQLPVKIPVREPQQEYEPVYLARFPVLRQSQPLYYDHSFFSAHGAALPLIGGRHH